MSNLFEKVFFTTGEYQEIADLFKLGKIRKLYFFKTHGFESSKALITAIKGKFIISAYQFPKRGNLVGKSELSIEEEINFVNFLKSLPVPHYLKSKQGKFIEHKFGFMVTVYNYLPGKHPKKITPERARQLGVFLGKFHKIGKKFKKQLLSRRQFYELSDKTIKRMDVYATKQKNSKLKSVVKEVREGVLRNQLPQNISRGPIHVDIKPENELFIGKNLSGIIDFGIFYRGPLLVDVGKTIMWNCYREDKIDRQLFKSFINGYLSQIKMIAREKSLLKRAILFGIYAHIYVDLYHVPLKRVPESYTLSLIKTFLPVARWLENNSID